MREVTQPRVSPLVILLCVFCAATWHQTSATCQGKINVAIAMDASQSLGKLNFLHVKAFGKSIAEHLLTENEDANVFVVAFAREVDVIVGEKMNVNKTIAAIDAFDKKLIPETNTNLAIDTSSKILQTKGDPEKPSVIFIVTDGRATSGLQVVTESAKKAAAQRNILVAVGVGKDFAYEELLYITAGRKEHVLNGTFANLNFDVLAETLETICHLSVTDPTDPAIERPKCQVGGTIAIGVEVSPLLKALEQQQLMYLLNMLNSGTFTAVSNGEKITPFLPVSQITKGSWKNMDSTAIAPYDMLQTMINKLMQQQYGPKIAVVIIDDTFWKTNLYNLVATKRIVEKAEKQGITVIALIIGRQAVGMEKVLTSIFGTVNMLSVNSQDIDSTVTSGFNQLLNRVCTVLSAFDATTTTSTTTTTTTPAPTTTVTTPQPLDYFNGALDVHITFDVCQAVSLKDVYFGTYEHFTALLADRLVFGPSNVSLTASLTYCSGVEIIAQSREYIFESHYSLGLAKEGSSEMVDATTIVNDVIQRWDNTLENVGIIFITEDNVEVGLQNAVNKARALNIILMAVTLTLDGMPNPAMAEKAALIDASYVQMNYSQLYAVPGLVTTIMKRIPSLYKEPIQAMIGITLDGTLPRQRFSGVDYVLQNLRTMINSVIKDQAYTTSFQHDLFYNLEMKRRANIFRRIEYYNQIGNNQPDYVIIITNRPPLDADIINAAINRANSAGVNIFLTGYTGDLSLPKEMIAAEIDQENKFIAILIDSAESVSRGDIFEAYRVAASLLYRLNNTVKVEVSTFDVNAHIEIPPMEFSKTTRKAFVEEMSQITHLMLKPQLYKAVERLSQVSEDNENVRTVGVMFIADKPRYINLLNLFRDHIYADRTTLIVVDISPDKDIEGLEQDSALFPMHIISTRNLDFDDLPEQILGYMNSLGYSKYHTVFTIGQIGPLEQNFHLFENMLEEFEQATYNYMFSTEFGLITMENNALFDYLNIDMDDVIVILRRLMKVSDRGSETALDYSTGLLQHRMAQTQKQGVSVIITDENPKFPDQLAAKALKAREEDAKHVLVMGVGESLNISSLLSLNNVGDGDLCVAFDGEDLRYSCVGWLVNKLQTLPTLTPSLTSTTAVPSTTTTTFIPSISSTVTTNIPPQPSTNIPTTTTSSATSTPYASTSPIATTLSITTSSPIAIISSIATTSPTSPTSAIITVSSTAYTEIPTTVETSTTKETTTPAISTIVTTTAAIKTTTATTVTTTATPASTTLSTVKPTPYGLLCNAQAHVGIGVTSSLQVREVFETFQDNITQAVGDDVKFKFLFFYNSQLFEPATEMKNTDPEAFQSVVVEVNTRLTNLYTGQSNLVALILTDAKSAAGGISSDVFNSLSTYVEFVVFGIGQFSTSAVADMKKLTRNKPHSLIMVDSIDDVDNDRSITYLSKAVCDAVTKTPALDIRTNITRICDNLPMDNRFGVDAQNVWYPFDCTKFINCIRFGTTVRANVILCPSSARFNTVTRKCDMSQDVECREVSAEKYALEIGKIVDPPTPKVVNLTEECINNCFKSEDLTDNYGYTYHPTNCSKFIVCRRQGYTNPGYMYTTKVVECPLGQFWDSQKKLCVPSHLANCPADLCKMKSMFSFWNVQSCRHFYACDSGKSRLGDCAVGKKFQLNGHCVDDPLKTCTDLIVKPGEPCYNLPWTDSTMYIDRTIGKNGQLTSCPVGKQYEHHTCSCSKNYIIGSCQPVLSKTMDAVMSINNVWMRGGVASFFGLGLLTMPQPSPLTDTFLIHVLISVSKSNQDTVILSSCPDPDMSAFTLRLTNDQLIANVKLASGAVNLLSNIQFDTWNQVNVAYNGQTIVLQTDFATDQVLATGPIQGCQNSYVLGSDDGFYGDIDEIIVYDCIPDQSSNIFN